MTPGMPGPLLRLKTGTESATPSVNGVIARNLVRLSALLGDDACATLARQTCSSFAVEILQYPFLFVGLLDAVIGLELGVCLVTGVLATDQVSRPAADDISGEETPVSAWDQVTNRVREEAGLAASTSAAAEALVDVRPGRPSMWLQTRNPVFRELGRTRHLRNHLLVCESGQCHTVDV